MPLRVVVNSDLYNVPDQLKHHAALNKQRVRQSVDPLGEIGRGRMDIRVMRACEPASYSLGEIRLTGFDIRLRPVPRSIIVPLPRRHPSAACCV
jgi:hypothetical protein